MTDAVLDQPMALAEEPIGRRHVAAAVVGNALEFYDFVTYTFFAVQIGAAFFPSHDPFIQQMSSLITFGVGFVTRPIGALVIGRYGDRVGRKPAMMLSFSLMGLAILGLALTPTFAQIGVAAPVLVVAWRLIQGFALGGEVGPTTAYLIEAAPPGRRGLYGSLQYASQGFSSLVGGLVGVVISATVGDAALGAWGWRLAFLIGALVLPWGLWLRRSLPETRHRAEARTAAQPAAATLRGHGRIIALGLMITANGTIATYIFNNMTSYAQTTLKMAPGAALAASIVVGLTLIVFGLLGGALSDRIGRKPMMLWPRLLLMLAVVPGFTLLAAHPDHTTLLVVTGVLSTIAVLAGSTGITAVVESMHRDVRSLAFAGVYSTAVAVFGGTTQPIITWMVKATGNPAAPAWYLVAACAVGVVAILLLPESRPSARA